MSRAAGASAFQSLIYPGRSVPDFCGLVGLLPHADYIALPIPPSSEIDRENSAHDKTTPSDGWGVFSGTSAAAPQLAGVCALLPEKDRTLTASDIKAILKRTARDVTVGHANPASDPKGAGVGPGAATTGRPGPAWWMRSRRGRRCKVTRDCCILQVRR